MEIVLTRHTSVDVPQGVCYGWTDVPLKNTFEEEAAITKARLEEYGTFDVAFSSPLMRARKLATFCGYPNHITDDRLKEMNMGEWEMKPFDAINDPNLQRWYDDYMHIAATGGESFDSFYQRVASFLEELRHEKYKRVAIFTHGGVLLCAGIYAGLFPAEGCFAHHMDYGCSQIIRL